MSLPVQRNHTYSRDIATNLVQPVVIVDPNSGNAQGSLPFGADYMIQSNPDGGGNYQTVVYKVGGASGTVVRTITMTFDGSGNVLTYTES